MILHNAKNGFLSAIYNEEYCPEVVRIYTSEDHETVNERIEPDVTVSHDLFKTTLSIELKDEIYVITLDNIINDILEVEHENETLFSDH